MIRAAPACPAPRSRPARRGASSSPPPPTPRASTASRSLPAGTWEILVQLEGFAPVRRPDVRLALGQLLRVDVALSLGGVQETVTITEADSPVIDVKQSASFATIRDEQIDKLPRGRDFLSLASQAPGATVQNVSAGLSIDGGSGADNRFIIDGIDTTDLQMGVSGKRLVTDVIDEVQVEVLGLRRGVRRGDRRRRERGHQDRHERVPRLRRGLLLRRRPRRRPAPDRPHRPDRRHPGGDGDLPGGRLLDVGAGVHARGAHHPGPAVVLRVVHPLVPDDRAHRDLPLERGDADRAPHGPQPVRDRHPLGAARAAAGTRSAGVNWAPYEKDGDLPALDGSSTPTTPFGDFDQDRREPLGLGLGRLHPGAAGALQPARRLLPHEQRRRRQPRRGPLPVRRGRTRASPACPPTSSGRAASRRSRTTSATAAGHPGPARLPGGRHVVRAGGGPAHAQGRGPVRPHRQRRLQRLPEAARALLLGRHLRGDGRHALPEPLRVRARVLHRDHGRHPERQLGPLRPGQLDDRQPLHPQPGPAHREREGAVLLRQPGGHPDDGDRLRLRGQDRAPRRLLVGPLRATAASRPTGAGACSTTS